MTFSGTWSGLIWMFSRLQSEKPEKINWLSESERPDWSPELSSHHVFLCEWMEVINKKTCFHIKYNFYCQHKQISHDENIKRKSLIQDWRNFIVPTVTESFLLFEQHGETFTLVRFWSRFHGGNVEIVINESRSLKYSCLRSWIKNFFPVRW